MSSSRGPLLRDVLKHVEFREGLLQLSLSDIRVFDVERVEDRLVEELALLLIAAQVELIRSFEQPEAGFD